jgi:hypothetical protein
MGQGLVHFIGTMATMDNMSAPKKKLRGFPHVFYFWNFKSAFLGDMKQLWSRH